MVTNFGGEAGKKYRLTDLGFVISFSYYKIDIRNSAVHLVIPAIQQLS